MKRFIRLFTFSLLLEFILIFIAGLCFYNRVYSIQSLFNGISYILVFYTAISFILSLIISVKQEKRYKYLNGLISNLKESKEPVFPKIEDKDIVRLFSSLKEIYTILKKNSYNVYNERQKLDLIINSIDDGLLLLEKDKVQIANKAAINFLGLKNYEGKNIIDTMSGHVFISIFEKILENKQFEDEIKLKEKWFFIKSIPLEEKIIVLIRDITRHKSYTFMKAKFFEDASHELKTPITSILGYSETLLEEDLDNRTRKKFIRYIYENAKNLAELVEDILTLHKLESNKQPLQGKCNMKSISEELKISFGNTLHKKNIEFIVECDEEVIEIPCSYIKSVLWNLVDNAVKYTNEGFIKVKCEKNESTILLTVKDSGVGIEREHLPYIFDRFYTTQKGRDRKISGTGLGLAIVKHIVQLYEGNINVESEPLKGSKFEIKIPLTSGG